MKLRNTLLNGLAYQAGWFACVLGGNNLALWAAAILLPLHFLCVSRSPREWSLIAVFGVIGLGMDLCWQQAGLLEFRGAGVAGVPPWLAVLWLLFATTVFHSLAFLQQRLALAALLGALAGPLSYVAGLALGAAESAHPAALVALAMAPAWALLLPALLYLARPAPGPAAARSDRLVEE